MCEPAARTSAYASARSGGPAHVLMVSYLFSPTDLPPARRVRALRDAFVEVGVRGSVLTSSLSGSPPGEEEAFVLRAPDLRARIAGRYRVLGEPGMRIVSASGRRRWTRLLVPDTTAFSWLPSALALAARLGRTDRPDAVFTTSPPESTHLVGLALHSVGVPWIADLRDGWTFEPPTLRPYFRFLDRALERAVVQRANLVTAATEPLVAHLARVKGSRTRVVELTNGFDPRSMEASRDERSSLDQSRFSLVYTGTGILDGKDPLPFLRGLRRLLAEQPALRQKLEVVFAGNFTREEANAMLAPELSGVFRFLGRVEHARALGLQRAADGLLLITTRGATSIATGKIYEYLAACKPIFALAEGNVAVELLGRSGKHVTAPPGDEEGIVEGLRAYIDVWVSDRRQYAHKPGFDPYEYALPRIARRLLDLLVEIGALRHA